MLLVARPQDNRVPSPMRCFCLLLQDVNLDDCGAGEIATVINGAGEGLKPSRADQKQATVNAHWMYRRCSEEKHWWYAAPAEGL